MVSITWRITPKNFGDEVDGNQWFVSATLGDEWVDFPMNHENALWLGRFIKHAALMEIGEELHSTFCKVCTW